MEMKVIFLDIDGVFNKYDTLQKYGGFLGIEPELVLIFKRIISSTDAQVVLSSSWRAEAEWRLTIKEAGVDFEFLDCTPDEKGLTSRGTEVKKWLDLHPEVTRFCCIDDNTDFLSDQKLFKTNYFGKGLTDMLADEIIAYLNG